MTRGSYRLHFNIRRRTESPPVTVLVLIGRFPFSLQPVESLRKEFIFFRTGANPTTDLISQGKEVKEREKKGGARRKKKYYGHNELKNGGHFSIHLCVLLTVFLAIQSSVSNFQLGSKYLLRRTTASLYDDRRES